MSWKNASVNRTKNVLDKNGVGVSFGGIPLPLHPPLDRRNKYLHGEKAPERQRDTLARFLSLVISQISKFFLLDTSLRICYNDIIGC